MSSSIWTKLSRRKIVDLDDNSTKLKRVLSAFDLTLLGIGSTLGIGVYVLAGSVAKNDAGPAVVISFLVAALASVLAGLCYAEFGARVPKAGSAYVYSYVCVGELIGFIVGWNLIMEYVIGVASVAKGYSGYVDSLCHGCLKETLTEHFAIRVAFLSPYVDFFAFALTLAITGILAFGVKESSFFNNIFTGLNLIVVFFVIIAGAVFAKPSNWTIDASTVNLTAIAIQYPTKKIGRLGTGGFAPFGFTGIMKGAATCFYGFVGFDCIATTGEEARNPQRSIPIAIICSLFMIFLAYFGISSIITMMVPYYLQDADAPLPEAFMYVGFDVGKWIVSIGALCGLSTSLLGSMFPMPRVIYAMASDGVLFPWLAGVHPTTKTPLRATLIAGSLAAIMAALFDLESLIDMMSIGTLTAYTLVAVCVLVLRYRKDEDNNTSNQANHLTPPTATTSFSLSSCLRQVFAMNKQEKDSSIPTALSSLYSGWAVFAYCIFAIAFCAVAIFADDKLMEGHTGYIILISGIGLLILSSLVSLTMQPASRIKLSFKVPLVPLIPGLSILTNIYLIMKLTTPTWIRFGVWLLIGMVIYLICLFSGMSDKAYEASVEEANKRKTSNILVPGLNASGILGVDPKVGNSTANHSPGPHFSGAIQNHLAQKPSMENINENGALTLINEDHENVVSTDNDPENATSISKRNGLSGRTDAAENGDCSTVISPKTFEVDPEPGSNKKATMNSECESPERLVDSVLALAQQQSAELRTFKQNLDIELNNLDEILSAEPKKSKSS